MIKNLSLLSMLIFTLLPVFELNDTIFYINVGIFAIIILTLIYLVVTSLKKGSVKLSELLFDDLATMVADVYIGIVGVSVCYCLNPGKIIYWWWFYLTFSLTMIVSFLLKKHK